MKKMSILLLIASTLSTVCCGQSIEPKPFTNPHSVTLSWIPSPTNGTPNGSPVKFITIYRGTKPGGETKLETVPIESLPKCAPPIRNGAQCYVDSTVKAGMHYYYQVSSTDEAGVESTRSEEVEASLEKIKGGDRDVDRART